MSKTVYAATGTYTSTALNEVVLIDKGLILSGGWDAAITTQSGMSTIDGRGARRGVAVNSNMVAAIEYLSFRRASSIWASRSSTQLNYLPET